MTRWAAPTIDRPRVAAAAALGLGLLALAAATVAGRDGGWLAWVVTRRPQLVAEPLS